MDGAGFELEGVRLDFESVTVARMSDRFNLKRVQFGLNLKGSSFV